MTENKKILLLAINLLLIKENFPEKKFLDILYIIKNKKNIYKKYINKKNIKKIFGKDLINLFEIIEKEIILDDSIINKLEKKIKKNKLEKYINNILKNENENNNKIYYNEDERNFLIINSIILTENKNYNEINILKYNYFNTENYKLYFDKNIEHCKINFSLIKDENNKIEEHEEHDEIDELILNSYFNNFNDFNLINRLIYFLINKDSMKKNEKIYVTSYLNEQDIPEEKNIYIIIDSDIVDIDTYNNSELIIKLEGRKYLIKKSKVIKDKKKLIDLSKLSIKEKEDFIKNKNKKIFYKNITKNIKIKKRTECYFYNQETEKEELVEDVEVVYLTDIFNNKENLEKNYYKKLLNLKEQEYPILKNEIKKIENTNLSFLLFQNNFFRKVINDKYNIIYQDLYFPEVNFNYKFYEEISQNLVILISEYSKNEYSTEIIKIFINLFFLYSLYEKINIIEFEYNANIIKEIKKYINNIKENIDYFKDNKEIVELKKNINYINFQELFNYIKNENTVLEDFYLTLNFNYTNSYKSFLNSYGYDRVNKLFMFLEGYTAYICNYFLNEESILRITNFENFIKDKNKYSTTFGTWDKEIDNINEKEFIKTTNLTVNKIKKLKKIINKFRTLRNEIKGHGCYYNINENKISELEEYFFDNIDILKEINLEIQEIKLNEIKHQVYYEQEDLILTFKNFYFENGFNKIEFYNYSNPEIRKKEEINIGYYLYYLNIELIKNYFFEELKKYYVNELECLRGYSYLNLKYRFDFNSFEKNYKNDQIVFEVNILKCVDEEYLKELIKEENLELNIISEKKIELIYNFEEEFSIFEENNKNKILFKIERIIRLIELKILH